MPFTYVTFFIMSNLSVFVCGCVCVHLCLWEFQIHTNLENSWNEEEVWRVEMYVSFGIMSLGLLSLLAITSIPSVNSALNWREFSFIQAFEEDAYRFYLPPSFAVSVALPVCVILGKVFLLLPCVACKLHRIRRGYETKHTENNFNTVVSATHISPERVTIM
ncbi:metalloreductase STEAP2-like isoform X2 [Osmerus eperlanus]|uniref:metalloreductase STEAP2-like isoform X2 n=1 Tax=Osmerus eperlanus TaxID=29151 RepID=UPI002E0E2C19